MRKWLFLIIPLFLLSCQNEDQEGAKPSLSLRERSVLQKIVLEKNRVEEKRQRLQRKAIFFRSQGSNIPCPDLKGVKREIKEKDKIAFALRCQGGIRGYRKRVLFPSASTSKALLLLAFLQKEENIGPYRSLLSSMIRYSDNEAADRIYYLLGDQALRDTARKAGLRDTVFVGYWSSILFSPADYVRLFASMPKSFPRSRREFASNLLSSITAEQSWGIEKVFSAWRVYFKGGWRPEGSGYLLSQGALLQKGEQRFALAIFTNGFPDQSSAVSSLEGLARAIQESLRER